MIVGRWLSDRARSTPSRIAIDYERGDHVVRRVVDPLGVVLKGGVWTPPDVDLNAAADAETTATNTSEAAIARAAILMCVLPFAMCSLTTNSLSISGHVRHNQTRSRKHAFTSTINFDWPAGPWNARNSPTKHHAVWFVLRT